MREKRENRNPLFPPRSREKLRESESDERQSRRMSLPRVETQFFNRARYRARARPRFSGPFSPGAFKDRGRAR
jgi:hypothetical protein